MYKVFRTKTFKETIQASPKELYRIEKIEDQLKINPYIGKPLGYKWFREKRLNGFRVYFLIYEKLKSVLLVGFSGKKDQQRTINTIRLFLAKYREEIYKLST